MAGEFLGHDEVDVAAAEAGDEEDAVGVEIEEAVGGGACVTVNYPTLVLTGSCRTIPRMPKWMRR